MNEIFSALGEIAKLCLKGFYHFLRKHPRYAFMLPFLLLAAYQRYTYVFFAPYLGIGEQDLTLVRQLLSGQLIFFGTPVLNHDFALGPFYQYLIAFPLALLSGSPLGPALLAAFLGVLTVYIIYLIGKAMFNLQVGIFSAGLYAVSPLVIAYAYESWSRDILPFFTALLIFFVYKSAASARPFWYHLLVGFFLGICLQLDYLISFVLVIIPLYILITEIVVKGKHFILPLLRYYFYMTIGFLISLAPYLYYEATHGFPNISAYFDTIFISLNNPALTEELLTVPQNFYMLFSRLILHYPSIDQVIYYSQSQLSFMSIFAIILIIFSFIALVFDRNRFVLLLVVLWLGVGSVFYTLFRQDVFLHQFTALYTVIVLFVGYFLGSLFHLFDQERIKNAQQLISSTQDSQTYTTIQVDVTDKRKLYAHWFCIAVSVWVFILIALLNFSILPLNSTTKEEQDKAKKVAESIAEHSKEKPFNFTVLAEPAKRGEEYISALQQAKQVPVEIAYIPLDPKRVTVMEQMFVVCEDPECKPLQNNNPQIRGFGNAAVIEEWMAEGVKIYRLVHPIEK